MKHALKRANLNRATLAALLVGTLLAAINHYDMFLSGQFNSMRMVQVLITYLVPFFVSLISSVMAELHRDQEQ